MANKAVDQYRVAIITATCDQLVEAMTLQTKELSRRRGSWMTRSLGMKDAIRIVEKYKELATKAGE